MYAAHRICIMWGDICDIACGSGTHRPTACSDERATNSLGIAAGRSKQLVTGEVQYQGVVMRQRPHLPGSCQISETNSDSV